MRTETGLAALPKLAGLLLASMLAASWGGCDRAGSPEPPPGVRAIRPLSPSGDHCVEMYSACRPAPGGGDELCTSAPFELDCGASGTLPSTGETLRCECE